MIDARDVGDAMRMRRVQFNRLAGRCPERDNRATLARQIAASSRSPQRLKFPQTSDNTTGGLLDAGGPGPHPILNQPQSTICVHMSLGRGYLTGWPGRLGLPPVETVAADEFRWCLEHGQRHQKAAIRNGQPGTSMVAVDAGG